MIQISDLTKIYKMGDTEVFALRGVSLSIEDGDFVAIMGPSGSGKSTLTQILGLLDVPTSGSYKFNDKEVSRLSEDALSVLRREEVGFIFQQFNLLPRMSAFENVALPLLYSQTSNEDEYAESLLENVGLKSRAHHRPNELSGGQQQRVAIARALVNRPKMILADEPTGNLDSVSEKEIMGILKKLNDEGITVVIVTHEEEIGQQAKRLVRMRDGVIQSDERTGGVSTPNLNAVTFGEKNAQTESASEVKTIQLLEHFHQGFKTLAANKIRTCLSMLGILIGVGAVVAMLALGKGAQKEIEGQLASLGSNLLVLRPGATRVGGVSQQAGTSTRLTQEDAAAISNNVGEVSAVAPSVSGRAQLTYRDKNWNTQVQGVAPEYAHMHASDPQVGRFFTDEDNKKRQRYVVVGTTIVRELLGTESPIGAMIKINKINFQIIGVLPAKGANGFRDQDDVVLIPLNTAMFRLLGKDYVDTIEIEVANATAVDTVQDTILTLMQKRHRVPLSQQQEAFQIRNMADIQAALSQSSKTMSLLLASIAAISLLVGGIGIMNIMLVSVTERTKEIGLRKAIGARRIDILLQFLAESIVVSVVGGLLGIFIGWLITVLLSSLAGWATSVSLESTLLAFFFSAFIGVIFGIYPARKASKLHPIEALRYE